MGGTQPDAVSSVGLVADDVLRLRAVIGRLARQLRSQPSEFGLSPTEFSVLAAVVRMGPLVAGELAEFEGINPTMLSRIVGRLSDEGLVDREQHPDDRRAILVEVTAKGRRVYERVKAQRVRILTEGIEQLPEPEVRALLAALPALERLSEELKLPSPRRSRAGAT